MEIKRCEKGHFYDAEANSTCPQCAAEMGMGGFSMETTYGSGVEDYPPTEAAGSGFGNIGETVPVGGSDGGYGETVPVNGFGGEVEDIGPTMPSNGISGGPGNYEPTVGYLSEPPLDSKPINGGGVMEDYGVTVVAPINNKASVAFSPVTGWLVCTEGPAKGTDYRIRAGYNYIGRSEHMDICIRGDKQISREKHALIAYDHEEHVFFFGPADGKSLVRINGKMVMSPTEIKAYDVISIGETKLLFVPLCGERFNWDE